MNTRLAPFNNLKARQAVNFAVDRLATVRLFGGTNLGQPSCTILPKGFPGHVDYCPYTKNPGTKWTAPDMAKAQQLVKESGTAGQKVAIVVQDDAVNRAIGTYLQSVLNKLGWKASIKVLSNNIQFTYIQNTKNKVQISLSQWYQDYPAAADFLYILDSCGSFHPGSDTSINIAGFCDKKIQAQMDQRRGARRHESHRRQQAVGADRQAGDRHGAAGDALQPEEHRLHLEARRQLHVQRAVLLPGRSGLGAVTLRLGARL